MMGAVREREIWAVGVRVRGRCENGEFVVEGARMATSLESNPVTSCARIEMGEIFGRFRRERKKLYYSGLEAFMQPRDEED